MIELIRDFFSKFKINSEDFGSYPIEKLEDTVEKNGVVFNITLEKQILKVKYSQVKEKFEKEYLDSTKKIEKRFQKSQASYDEKINNHLDKIDDLDSLNLELINKEE